MGDGVLAYFGYPQAHEHDAERAVQAGLALVDAVPKLATPRRRAAAGADRHRDRARRRRRPDRIGRGAGARHRRRDAEPRGAAARDRRARHGRHVREHAAADRQSVRAQRPRRARTSRASTGRCALWAALRPSAVASRFEALHARRPRRLWSAARKRSNCCCGAGRRAEGGEGQVVLLSGEAGIGKSRLTAALMERLGGEPHTRLRYFCSPQHTDSALHPVIIQFERAAGLAHDDTPSGAARQARCTCWRRPRRRRRMPRSWPSCCRCRTMAAIPRSKLAGPAAPAADVAGADRADGSAGRAKARC